jgi:hypothetical protein
VKPRRGRPPLDREGPSVQLQVRFTAQQYDALCARAHAQRKSLSALVRATLGDRFLSPKNRRDA